MASGLAELGPKLGPIVWQFATDQGRSIPTDFEAFLKLLPSTRRRRRRCATPSKCATRAS